MYVLILVVVLTIVAGLLPLMFKIEKSAIVSISSLGVGMFIGTSLCLIIPEGIDIVGKQIGGIPVLFGFSLLLLVENLPPIGAIRSIRYLRPLTFGLVLHSLIDGVSLAISMKSTLSAPIVMAILLHKLPSATSLTACLMNEGVLDQRGIIFQLIIFAVSSPLAALFASFWISDSAKYFCGVMILFSGGTFLYIAVCHVLPQVKDKDRILGENLIYIALGMLLSVFLTIFQA